MHKHHKLFEEYLKKHDGRYTSQKKEITTEIFKVKDHFEIEDFIDTLRLKKEIKLSRATVYRTIKQLLDAGLLQKISTRDGKVFYENTTPQTQHTHLICNTCGKIIEIKEKTINDYIDLYCEKKKFKPEYLSLHVYGQCKTCVKKD